MHEKHEAAAVTEGPCADTGLSFYEPLCSSALPLSVKLWSLWSPCACASVSNCWRERDSGVCNEVPRFTHTRRSQSAYVVSQTLHRHLRAVQRLSAAKQPCAAPGHSLPRELPGRGESHDPGRAETFWCGGRSLQIQLEQLQEGDALWQHLKVSPETPAQAVAALSA